MRLLLDTNVLIRFERKNHSSSDMLRELRITYPDTDFIVSAVSAVELAHGVARTKDELTGFQRKAFLEGICDAFDVVSINTAIAERAGIIEGQLAAQGLIVDLADLLIGVTALHLGYAVLTHHTRHFEMIPGLEVVAPTFTL